MGPTESDLPPGQAAPGSGKSFYPFLVLWILWMAFLLAMMVLRMKTTSV